MRFLVLGASGMAGHAVGLWLQERGHDVVGFSRRAVAFFPCVEGDVRDDDTLRETISGGGFDAVVNLVASLNDASERRRSEAVYLNALLPHRLAEIVERESCRLVHISTDGIFKGDAGPYRECDLPDDESFYGRTKALGEPSGAKVVTLRTCIVGPDVDPDGTGLLNWFMRQRGSVLGFTNALWTGITTIELARIIEKSVESHSFGLVQTVPRSGISKYELLGLFKKCFGRDSVRIESSDEPRIDRRLVQSTSPLCAGIPDYGDQMAKMADWVSRHQGIYPSFYRSGANDA